MAIKPLLLAALHPHPELVPTFTVPVPPAAVKDWLEDDREYLQAWPAVIVSVKLVVYWISPAYARSVVVPGGPDTTRSHVAVPLESVSTIPSGALHAAGACTVGSWPSTIRTLMFGTGAPTCMPLWAITRTTTPPGTVLPDAAVIVRLSSDGFINWTLGGVASGTVVMKKFTAPKLDVAVIISV